LAGYILVREGQSGNNDVSSIPKNDPVEIGDCTRTSRLENEPVYDRALSLVNEKYTMWESGGKSNYGSYYFFPSQLTNCIKIIEGDIRDSVEAEGYFIFNDEEIKTNYFPIYVDKEYRKTDDLVTALLLVHEITHVRQYLEGDKNTSCIDREVEAFDATYNFYRWQYGENEKTLNLRILYDEDLHPQLQTIKGISQILNAGVITPLSQLCNGVVGEKCTDRINQDRSRKIKTIISQDSYYKEQCGL
jgi:hypothetical protein